MSGVLAHLPVLQVVLPLMAAPVCVLLGRGERAWRLALLVSWLCFITAMLLLAEVKDGGRISYELGGWAAPWGIEYVVDALNAFVLVIVSGASALVLLFARNSVAQEIAESRRALFYSAWLLCLTGLLGITVTGDAFNVFVFLEISSLSAYTLVAISQRPRAMLAAFRYLVMGTVGGTFILIGIGMMYWMTGTLNMADLAVRLPAVMHTRTVQTAFAMLTVGFALKMAMFPVHQWLPEAYTRAPSAVSAFFAATSTKVAVYAMVRFFYGIFGPVYTFEAMHLGDILMPMALLGIIIASLVALYQDDVKRLFAWSSLAQLGYMGLGISMASAAGLTSTLVHVFNHALMKCGIFVALGCIAYRLGPLTVAGMAGLGRRMPWTMGGLLICTLSLVGVPLTAGFISKWYLLVAVFDRGWWPVAVIVVATSLVAAMYVWRVLHAAYFKQAPADSPGESATEAPWLMLVSLWSLALANLWFGVDTSISAGVTADIASALFGAAR